MELETGGYQDTGIGQERDAGPGLGQEEEERGERRLQEEPRGTTYHFGLVPVLAVEWESSGHVRCAGSRHTVVPSEEPGGEGGEGLTWDSSS